MSLKDLKAKTQGAADFATERKPPAESGAKRPMTSPGAQAFMHDTIVEYKRKAEDAEGKAASALAQLSGAERLLAKFDGAVAVKALDPATIRRSRWANRVEAEFVTAEYKTLKDEIANAGGNVQPIKVRVVNGSPPPAGADADEVVNGSPLYEIVFGHRRHQACLELGVPVFAIIEESMDDRSLFEAMDRENRGRKNLSAWEQGRMYDEALKGGLYPSLRRLAEALGVDHSLVSKTIQLAALPKEVVAAFASPLDLQVRWAKPLTDVLQQDPDGILRRAKVLAKNRESLDAAAIFDRLAGKETAPTTAGIDITAGGKRVAALRLGPKGRAVIEFEAGALAAERHADLAKLIQDFLAG